VFGTRRPPSSTPPQAELVVTKGMSLEMRANITSPHTRFGNANLPEIKTMGRIDLIINERAMVDGTDIGLDSQTFRSME
jgi:hypothetical protein